MSVRSDILDKAKQCVCGDRDKQYGDPEDSFHTIAMLWNSYLRGIGIDIELRPYDVAMMMVFFKIGRAIDTDYKQDTFVDMAGYTACAAEIRERELIRLKEANKKNYIFEDDWNRQIKGTDRYGTELNSTC